ncbi:4-hydroxythreonine-4-phosphate dehydrogenase PdxA [Notoacmeibacter sp. MSK16QG-6]|uniref:4-hydroxythreonine-4-phosphate dehydrogenase PdxA n=1 Tax=Notoacmeibacter sp. MSK16QG-6 TaxID=2957982 RepID=UPI0020A10244|nr:4-hydroxythreonine-4-phosphate dehydrogenase PdxA [Notoacmeibacter sp. MSK16QG-6]MCP1197980.1 4-hydroxythreonine-4-phosphate dehydrogenase PdxA [Notoacmeibacter sp. MSK16QG-6]
MTDKPLAVSCGDPAGIGPELLFRAYNRREPLGLPPFAVICDPDFLKARANRMGVGVSMKCIESWQEVPATFSEALPVLPLKARFDDCPGEPLTAHANGIIESIDRGVAASLSDEAAGLVTLPIAKAPLYDAGFAFPGHTEYLGSLSEKATATPVQPVMMLAGPSLRAVPVTIHIPLSAVPEALTDELLEQTIRITERDLRERFGIQCPRIAVSGLNPHAGESGKMGSEEMDLVAPVLDRLREEGFDIAGPLPADTMFHERARAGYDVAVCMYHDQALIAAKALAFDETVNVTLGLPFIRTSPDHGTAFDIAGKGVAREDSFIAALKMAAEMASGSSR